MVYLAEDTKLQRKVALKFLFPDQILDSRAKERLVNEARAASVLEHPHICTIHEINETETGRMFICMAYCEGETVKERMGRGEPSLDETLWIMEQVIEGLSAAHDKGIIHRDIKPTNLFITSQDRVQIMDFGLAKTVGSQSSTKPGTTKGTVTYMSPEQIKGDPIDHRTDIWSLGVVLYELLTGRRPFTGEYEVSVLYSIVNEEPWPLSRINEKLPPQLERVVNKALRKNPDDRYANLREMGEDLKRIRQSLRCGARSPLRNLLEKLGLKPLRKTTPFLLAVLIAAGVISVAGWPPFYPESREMVSVAVLDFENKTTDSSYVNFLPELLIDGLEESPYLRTISHRRMRQYFRDNRLVRGDLAAGIRLCRQAEIQFLVLPTILEVGKTLVITSQIYNVGNGIMEFRASENGKGRDAILPMIDRIAKKIRSGLKAERSWYSGCYHKSSRPATSSLAAYIIYAPLAADSLYDLGRSSYLGGDPQRAISLISQAVAMDSTFVDAYLDLAILYNSIGEIRKAMTSARRARELTRNHDELDRLKSDIVIYTVQRDWNRVIERMKEYLSLRPNDVRMRLKLGYIISRHKDDFKEAITQYEKFVELDPEDYSGQLDPVSDLLGEAYFYSDRFAEAMKAYKLYTPVTADSLYAMGRSLYSGDNPLKAIPPLERAVALDSNHVNSCNILAILYDAIGDSPQAVHYARRAKELSRDQGVKTFFHSVIVEYLVQRNWNQALEIIRQYLEIEPDNIYCQVNSGYLKTTFLGDYDGAIDDLRRVIELDPGNSSGYLGMAYNYLGHALLFQGRFPEAQRALDQYKKLVPGRPDPLHSAAAAWHFRGYYGRAIDEYSRIIRDYPGYYSSYEDRGLAYMATGKWRDAVMDFNRFLSAVPHGLLPVGHIHLAMVYLTQRNFPLAHQEIDESLARKSHLYSSHWLRGLIALEEGAGTLKPREELERMRELLEGEGVIKEKTLYYHLWGRILLAEKDVSRGIELLRRAAEVSPVKVPAPGIHYFRKELIRGFLASGRSAEAEEEISALMRLNQHDGELNYLAGLVREQRGRRSEAVDYFRRSRWVWKEADNDYYPLRQVISKLEKLDAEG